MCTGLKWVKTPIFTNLLETYTKTVQLLCSHFFILQLIFIQKQSSRSVLKKRCSGNMQQIYRRTPMPKCDFNKVALLCNFIKITLWHGCSPVNLLHIFRTSFLTWTAASGSFLVKCSTGSWKHQWIIWRDKLRDLPPSQKSKPKIFSGSFLSRILSHFSRLYLPY